MVKYSPDGKLVALCGEGNYTIYSAPSLKEKLSGTARDFVWSAGGEFAIRENSAIKIFNKSYRVWICQSNIHVLLIVFYVCLLT